MCRPIALNPTCGRPARRNRCHRWQDCTLAPARAHQARQPRLLQRQSAISPGPSASEAGVAHSATR